ncbi:hypothetical protein LUZ60_007971 [Juncus effusus]|nr:hypothetical protein LUZ60_007971 [Juncus effusus]
MASLPSLALTSTTLPKLADSDLKTRNSSSLDKNVSYRPNSLKPRIKSKNSPRTLDLEEALNSLKEGNQFDSTTYVPPLEHCIATNSLSNAEILLSHILKTGAIKDGYIAVTLVNTFMKCGSPTHAQKLFDKISERSIVMWTALISGYVRNSDPQSAIQKFIDLLEADFRPVIYSFWAVLSACSDLCNLKFGEQIHTQIIKFGGELEIEVSGSLSTMYSKCGNLKSAIKVFEKLPKRDVSSWTSIISACGDNYEPFLGLRLFIDMLHDGIWPNEVTLSSVSSLLCSIEYLKVGPTRQFHAFCVKFGCGSMAHTRNSIMYMYLKCGQIEDAIKLFENMVRVNLVTVNAMIAGLNRRMGNLNDDLLVFSSGTEALRIFRNLNRSLTRPDMFTFSSIISVCANLLALEEGTQIHAQMVKSGVLNDVVTTSSLLNMYGKCGNVFEARKVFDEMPFRDRTSVSYTSMISCYTQNGKFKEAIELFEEMISNDITPNLVTFIGVLSACSSAQLVDKAEHYFKMMKEEYKIQPVTGHYACMVDMFARLGKIEEAFAFINKEDFAPSEVIWSMLVASCRSQGNMDLAFYAAEKLLQVKPEMAETYKLLFNMYKLSGKWQDANRVRKLMSTYKIPIIKDRSWITTKGKVHYFWGHGRYHPQNVEINEMLDNLIEKAKELGYVPYSNNEGSEGEDEEKEKGYSELVKYHSEKVAVSFGLMSVPKGVAIRVYKNISMCKDCHSFLKIISDLMDREIVVKDSRRLHVFKDGHCLCGDFMKEV